MSNKRLKKGAESIQEEINIHKSVKLKKALSEGNTGLARYYEKEIKRLEEQLSEKQKKLLPRSKRKQ